MSGVVQKVGLAVVALVLGALESRLASAGDDSERAETLFATAQACLERGDWTCACDNFAASMAAEPSASTQLNIAKCQMHDGKPSVAWRTTQAAMKLNVEATYADESRRRALAEYGAKLSREIEATTAELVLRLPARPEGLEILLDGAPVPAADLETPIRLDSGRHEIVARAKGYVAARSFVLAVAGGRLEVPVALDPETAPAARPRDQPAKSDQPAPPSGAHPQSIAGWAVGAVGAAALGTSLALGIATALRSADAEASTACTSPDDNDRVRACNSLRDGARAFQTSAIALAIPGVALLGGGITLLATAPRRREPAGKVALSARGLGLSLRARF